MLFLENCTYKNFFLYQLLNKTFPSFLLNILNFNNHFIQDHHNLYDFNHGLHSITYYVPLSSQSLIDLVNRSWNMSRIYPEHTLQCKPTTPCSGSVHTFLVWNTWFRVTPNCNGVLLRCLRDWLNLSTVKMYWGLLQGNLMGHTGTQSQWTFNCSNWFWTFNMFY